VLFHTLPFLAFFALVYGAYRLLRDHRAQNLLLLAASYFFYGWWDWRFLGLLAGSTALDWAVALALDARGPDGAHRRTPAARRTLLSASVAANLGVLAFFKYANFFADSAVVALRALGLEADPVVLGIVLPVGISFYTFQTLSYTIDVYRGVLPACRSLPDFALFVSFFPQLVAGPIERAKDLLPQVQAPRTVRREDLDRAAWLVGWGLFKKVFVADNLARIADLGFAAPRPGGALALAAVYAFAFQIYADFSGYSDIARGLASAMGFRFQRNFERPYFAGDPTEFWRRWHTSLSTWLRDYLYIPLGGNRDGTLRTYRNLLATMLLGGLWHGAAWTFVAWGALHGAWLAAHRRWCESFPRVAAPGFASSAIRVVLCFHAVCLGWIFFRADSFDRAREMIGAVLLWQPGPGALFDSCLAYAAPLLLVDALQERRRDEFAVLALPWWARSAAYAGLWFLATFLGNFHAGQFLYFQF
jgi:alginate O-acetyltransferase complex protein AlgI